MNLVALYRHLIRKTNKRLFRALEYRETSSFQLLVFARSLFVDGEATYLELLVELQRNWEDLPGVQANGNPECPLHFSDEEIAAIEADSEGATLGINLMQDVQERLGSQLFQEQGLIESKKLEEAKKK